MYEFSFTHVRGCNFGYLRARKTGYQASASIHEGYGQMSYHKIPQFTYLTPDSDVVMLRLTAITPTRTGHVFNLDGSYPAAGDYRSWYASFFEAKRIAETAREKQFVRERYCDNLAKHYSAMSDAEKADTARLSVSYHWRGMYAHGKYDYDVEVAPYCGR